MENQLTKTSGVFFDIRLVGLYTGKFLLPTSLHFSLNHLVNEPLFLLPEYFPPSSLYRLTRALDL